MRALPSLLLLAVYASGSAAQQAPATEVYEVDGIRVVHAYEPGREIVAVRLHLLGGARQLTAEMAGVERLILLASGRGTVGFPGDSLRSMEARTGSRFFTSVGADWSVIGFTGLAEELEPSWSLFADRVARPTLQPAAVEIARNQALTSVRAQNDDPDATVQRVAEGIAYAGHPYAVSAEGTETSLSSLTPDDLRAYHAAHFVRSRMLLAIVGPVERQTVEELVRRTLGTLPLGSYMWTPPPLWTKQEASVTVEARPLPTNYITGYFGGPSATDPDYAAFQVAVIVLSGYVASEIRAQGLSYAAGASVVERAASGGVIHMSTVNPTASMEIVNDAIELFREGTIPRSLLRNFAEDSALDYYLSNQTSSQQASFLASSLLLQGRPQTVVEWVSDLRAIGGYDIRRMFREYIRNIQYGYVGSQMAVPREEMLKW